MFSKLETKGKFLNLIKNNYPKPITNIPNDEMLKAFLLRWGARQDCLLLLLLFNIVVVVLVGSIRQVKEIKGTKLKLMDMMVFVEI